MTSQRRSTSEPANIRSEFSATCVAEPRFAPPLRSSLRRWIANEGVDADHTFAILVAVGEAVANVMEHAYRAHDGSESGLLWLHAIRDGDELVVEVEDAGRWKPPVASDERGRGLFLMRALMTRVDVAREEHRTRVRLSFSLDSDASRRSLVS